MLSNARQLTIDDVTLHYHGGDEFSHAANKSIRSNKNKLRAAVLAFIGSRGAQGATSDECEVGLNLTHQTASARLTELKALGLVEQIGKRPTRSGRQAGVWQVK